MKNKLIKDALFKANMKQWQLAELMGISEGHLSRKLRHELPKEEQKQIISLIKSSEKDTEFDFENAIWFSRNRKRSTTETR